MWRRAEVIARCTCTACRLSWYPLRWRGYPSIWMGEYFIRVHRSYLVNKLHIESIAGNFLQVGVVAIPISKFMKKKVLGSLNMLSFSK